MDFSEIIGFILILFVFFIPLLRKLLVDKKKAEQKKEGIEEDYYEEEEPEPPPPPKVVQRPVTTERLVKKDFEFHTDFEDRKYESQITERELETHVEPEFRKRIVSEEFILEKKKRRRKKNVVDSLVNNRDPLQAMVILSEILNRPEQ